MKIDPYNFALYGFKVGAFFLRHSVVIKLVELLLTLMLHCRNVSLK